MAAVQAAAKAKKFGQAQPMAARCVKTGSSPIWRTKGFTGVGLRPTHKYTKLSQISKIFIALILN
ncbi:MAG: hypothetical protein UZ11_BCD004001353 [Bacteroidetes bacterium OLB11]|nr:MAG: hypothetical protein UZ11_BCD004001353 [Bacteroidetes bacterium OLB11]